MRWKNPIGNNSRCLCCELWVIGIALPVESIKYLHKNFIVCSRKWEDLFERHFLKHESQKSFESNCSNSVRVSNWVKVGFKLKLVTSPKINILNKTTATDITKTLCTDLLIIYTHTNMFLYEKLWRQQFVSRTHDTWNHSASYDCVCCSIHTYVRKYVYSRRKSETQRKQQNSKTPKAIKSAKY